VRDGRQGGADGLTSALTLLQELVADLPPYLKDWTPRSHIARRLQRYLDQYMECREICIRAKTLTDPAARLRDCAADLEGPAALGFKLRDEIEDEYGFVGRPDDGWPVYPEDDEDEASAG